MSPCPMLPSTRLPTVTTTATSSSLVLRRRCLVVLVVVLLEKTDTLLQEYEGLPLSIRMGPSAEGRRSIRSTERRWLLLLAVERAPTAASWIERIFFFSGGAVQCSMDRSIASLKVSHRQQHLHHIEGAVMRTRHQLLIISVAYQHFSIDHLLHSLLPFLSSLFTCSTSTAPRWERRY